MVAGVRWGVEVEEETDIFLCRRRRRRHRSRHDSLHGVTRVTCFLRHFYFAVQISAITLLIVRNEMRSVALRRKKSENRYHGTDPIVFASSG